MPLKELFGLSGPWIYALVSRIVPDPVLAADLAVEVFWRAQHSPRVRAMASRAAGVWLRVQARALAIDALRSSHSVISHPVAFRAEYLALTTQLRSVSVALLSLAPHEREVFELAYFEGLSHSEIAEISGRSLGTVKTWVRSSRLRIEHLTQSDQMQSAVPRKNTDVTNSETASALRRG
jgi:RNA polymerase sigma-70 factor (ECF subfamily)